MEKAADQYSKRPLYGMWRSLPLIDIANGDLVLDLPGELLSSLVLKEQHSQHEPHPTDSQQTLSGSLESVSQEPESHQPFKGSASCTLCNATFSTFTAQRDHTRTDWHGYNLKQKLHGLKTVTEIEFEKLIDELDMSISGSEDDSSDEDTEKIKEASLSALLRKQANLYEGEESDLGVRKRILGSSPMVQFTSSLLPLDMSLGIYRVLFTEQELKSVDLVDTLRKKQLQAFRPVKIGTIQSTPPPTSPSVFLCMIGGGHFAGMIISLTPKLIKGTTGQEERQAIVLAHKTFHRYTTRRKQGGSQSANDASKGNAHSAGAGIRRYNETALEAEIRALLVEWKNMIGACDLLFVRATGVTNRRTLFAAGPDQVLKSNDPRIKGFPFNTRRATQGELMRAFVELTRAKITKIAEVEQVEEKRKETPKKVKETQQITLSKEEQEALLHTSQIQALIRRSKASALASYISSNSISPNFIFHPPDAPGNRHAPTPLHLASSTNLSAVVHSLLVKAKADPTIINQDGKTSFELTGDRSTRDAYRIARSELGETAWDWSKAHCPPPMTKAEAEERDRTEKAEEQKAEHARRKAELERLEKERTSQPNNNPLNPSKPLGSSSMTAEDRREADSRGLSPEMRTKLERERRARAAEERIKKMSGTC